MMTTMNPRGMMTERMPTLGLTPMTAPAGAAMPMNVMMMPRCTMKMEKCDGGMKLTCTCDDPNACSMMQNLCQMMAGGMCSMSCLMNGMMVCCCNLTMGLCKVEMTKNGCTMTCTSGDEMCCDMIQSCCDCMATMMKAGCTCCLMMNGTPVCCC
jgi:hypothetical protein